MQILSEKDISTGYQNLFRSNGFEIVFKTGPQIYLPSSKQAAQRLLNKIHDFGISYYMQIPWSANLTLKDKLWLSMLDHHGLNKTLGLLPKTYVLDSQDDLNELQEVFNAAPVKMIAKGNKQARKSIQVFGTNEFDDVLASGKYVIVQQIIDSRNIISKSAFNIRIYLMVSFQHNKLEFSFSRNGKIIYSTSADEMITSVENDNHANPVLLSELYAEPTYRFTRKNIEKQAKKILAGLLKVIKNQYLPEGVDSNKRFCQLFGVDLIMDQKRNLKLLEVNLRPEMKSKFEHEKRFKDEVISDWLNHFLLQKTAPKTEWITV